MPEYSTPSDPFKTDPAARDDEDSLLSLMEALRAGSANALQELMDRLWSELVRFASWEMADTDAARDVVQEAFIYLWENRRSWIGSGSPRAYLYRIVRNRILDEGRRRAVRRRWADLEKARPHRGPSTPAEVFDAHELEETFFQAVSQLPASRREIFVLVALRGLSHREIADVLSISEQTVANQVTSALRSIREALRALSDDRF